MDKLKWGVLSTANIGLQKVLPAIQKSENGVVYAIASRNDRTARDAASHLSIPVSYSSYQDMLDDPEVEAVYNPLPNHMHVEWTIKAMEAGKHVLCEKPLALNQDDIRTLIKLRNKTGLTVCEAFMVRYHPQWIMTKKSVQEGKIGDLKNIQGFFSYYNIDKNNIRNIKEAGGGGILDIGCYPVTTSRLIFDEEPLRVASIIEFDPETETDRLASVLMEFPSGEASFSLSPPPLFFLKMHIFGTKGHLEVEIPFNAPPERSCRVFMSKGEHYYEDHELLEFPLCDQYTLQSESFVRTVRGEQINQLPLEDALSNMKVLDAIFKAGRSRKWEDVL